MARKLAAFMASLILDRQPLDLDLEILRTDGAKPHRSVLSGA
jgi:hypothetical protein